MVPRELVRDAHPLRWLLVSVVLAYLGVVLLGPVGALVLELLRTGLARAAAAVGSADALQALTRTAWVTLLAVVVNCLIGVVGALALVRQRFWTRRLIEVLTDLPLAVSPVMVGLAFLILFGNGGWLASVAGGLGVRVLFSFWGVAVATLFVTVPFTIREVAYVLEELGTTEEEAAATLGASDWQTFWRVTLPNLRFGLGYGLLMTVARSLGEFGAVLVLGGSISGRTQTATTFIHDAIEERNLAGAYGMAGLLALVSVVLLLGLEIAKHLHAKEKQ